jgi:hypothetical protein
MEHWRWLETQLAEEPSTLECLENLAQCCVNLQNNFQNNDEWKTQSPKIRQILKSYGAFLRNRLEGLATVESQLHELLNHTLQKLHELANDFWKKEIKGRYDEEDYFEKFYYWSNKH